MRVPSRDADTNPVGGQQTSGPILSTAEPVSSCVVVPTFRYLEVVLNAIAISDGRRCSSFFHLDSGSCCIHFVAKDKGHDSEVIAGGIPEGAEAWKGKISQDVTVTLTQPGLYAYKCTPHFGLGMVGLIQVDDDASNMAAIQALKLPTKAQSRMTELLAMVGTASGAGASTSASSAEPTSSAASTSSKQ